MSLLLVLLTNPLMTLLCVMVKMDMVQAERGER